MWYLFGAVKVRIRRRNLDSAVLPPGSKESHGRRVRRSCAIDLKAVIVEPDDQRRSGDGPGAVRALRHLESFSDPNFHGLRVRRNHAKHGAVVRIYAWILRLRNVKGRRFAIRVSLSPAQAGAQQRQNTYRSHLLLLSGSLFPLEMAEKHVYPSHICS